MSHLDHAKIVFGQVADDQEDKGIKKYGQPLDPLDNYCWLDMAIQEQVDGFQYLTAEMEKRTFIVGKIRKLITCRKDEYTNIEINHWLDKLEG